MKQVLMRNDTSLRENMRTREVITMKCSLNYLASRNVVDT